MSHKPNKVMIWLLAGLPVVVAGLGLASVPRRASESSDASLPVVPAQAPTPLMQTPMPFPRQDPLIAVAQAIPQGVGGLCPPLAISPAVAPTLPAAPSLIGMIPFQEAHWQGLEVIPSSARLKRALKIASDAPGVITDDVTWPADMQGFQAGDLITSVGEVPTPTLEDFIKATARVRERRRTEIQLLRGQGVQPRPGGDSGAAGNGQRRGRSDD